MEHIPLPTSAWHWENDHFACSLKEQSVVSHQSFIPSCHMTGRDQKAFTIEDIAIHDKE